MKKKLYLALIAVVMSIGLFSYSGMTQAYTSCRWVHQHWQNGYWVPGHQVCWNHGPVYSNCRWVRAHWWHGVWYPAQRVCWYR